MIEWCVVSPAINGRTDKADKIVAISDITTQSLIDLFPEHQDKLRVIYNGIDVQDVREKAKETTEIKLQHPALITVGRLDANKNPIRMLEVFEGVHVCRPEAHLYYLGYGALGAEVQRLAEEKKIAENVHLLGYHENPFPVIAQTDVCCMFSYSEGFPMALLESVALGKPFVSSVVGGARILANEQKCGKTVETNEAAVSAICELLDADKRKLSEECRRSVERFELKNYISQIEKLFDEVLG